MEQKKDRNAFDLKHALKRAMGGGVAGAAAMGIQVSALMVGSWADLTGTASHLPILRKRSTHNESPSKLFQIIDLTRLDIFGHVVDAVGGMSARILHYESSFGSFSAGPS